MGGPTKGSHGHHQGGMEAWRRYPCILTPQELVDKAEIGGQLLCHPTPCDAASRCVCEHTMVISIDEDAIFDMSHSSGVYVPGGQ